MALTRRLFIAGMGSAGVGLAVGGISHFFPLASPSVGPAWSPGREEFVPSTCLLCPSHCGILGRLVDGRLVRIDGNPLHPVSRGGLCAKGRAGLQLLYHPGRLRGPIERGGAPGSDRFEAVAWDEATRRIADELRSLRDGGRAGSMAWLVGDVDGGMGELIGRFLRVCGSPHLVRDDYADGADDVLELSQGIRQQPAFDLDRADLIVSFGAPLAEAWWGLPQAARARDLPPEQRRRWVQIDTRLSRTAIAADRWIAVRPGGYGALALSIAYVLLKEGLYDAEWVQGGVSGFEDWTDADGRPVSGYRSLVLRHGRPEDVSRRTGVDVDDIVTLAKEIGRAERPIAVWDQAVTWQRAGLSSALAIHALNIIAGSIQRPGGVDIPQPFPVNSLDQIAPVSAPDPVEGTPPLLAADWADRVLEGDSSPIQALFLYRSNPVASAPDPDKVRAALERIPLVVSFSPFLDESARYARFVLPDTTFLERWQDAPAPHTLPYPVWGIVQPIVPPLHESRATGDVVLDLAAAIGGSVGAAFPWSTMEEIVRARGLALAAMQRGSSFVAGFRRDELREMEARGWWIPHGQDSESFWDGLRGSGGWFDPYHDDWGRTAASKRADGRVALFPKEARDRLAAAFPDLVEGFLPLVATTTDGSGGDQESDGGDRLRLIPYRVMTLASGTTPLTPWLLEELGPLTGTSWEPWVEVHPETARHLGLESVERIRVVSERGSFKARLRLFEGAQPGVVNAPYGLHSSVSGWHALPTANPLAAVGSERDPVTGLPDWYSTRVRLEPA